MERYDNRSLRSYDYGRSGADVRDLFNEKVSNSRPIASIQSVRDRSNFIGIDRRVDRYASGCNLRLIERNFQKTRDIRIYTGERRYRAIRAKR